MEIAEQIDCPAPLPEGPVDALLTEMLVPAPYKVPENKAEKKAPRIRKGLQRKVVLEASSEDRGLHAARPPRLVSSLTITRCSFPQHSHGRALSHCVYLLRSMWRRRSGLTVRLHCQKA